MEKIGFLKRAQEFRSNVANRKYFPILDSMYTVASKYQNNLPSNFKLEGLYNFTVEDIKFVLSEIYPRRVYSCNLIKDTFFCSL